MNDYFYFIDNVFLCNDDLFDFYHEKISQRLLFQNPEIIKLITDKLRNNILNFAKKNSKVYENRLSIFTKKQLQNKKSWVSAGDWSGRLIKQSTSGSTTGEPFTYYNDNKYFDAIQRLSEFDLILKEYNLYNKPLKILNLFKHPYNPKPEGFFVETKNYSRHKFHNYGADNVTTFFVNWDNYIDNPDNWHETFLDFLSNNFFDIVLCSGPVINILTRYIKKNKFNHKFAYLLSHTTEFPRISDFDFLKNNSNIDYCCDHMRCWDGGASFFTCKYGTYHLNDNLAWVTEGPDHKMISTDYFNIISPFVNYWNGDLCEIEDEYKLCECGRHYRPFKMLENRPFALKGPTQLTEIRQQIKELTFKNKIDQVQFENLDVNLYINGILDEPEKEILKNILKDYKVKYYG